MMTFLLCFLFFLLGTAVSYFMFAFKKTMDMNLNIKTIQSINDYLTDKEYSLKNIKNPCTKSILGMEIAKMKFNLIHRFDSEKKIIGMANLMLGQISQGKFDEHINIECKYPLYNSLIVESNDMIDNLHQITLELDKGIIALDPNSQTKSSSDSLKGIISDKIKLLSNSTISYISKVASNDIQQGSSILDTNISSINETAKIISKISESVGAIKKIAFQIEILALNATVEAASVGEVGKGFVIVANNLRDLVIHTTTASNEINNLVSEAKSKSEESKEAILEAKKSFLSVVDKITNTKTNF